MEVEVGGAEVVLALRLMADMGGVVQEGRHGTLPLKGVGCCCCLGMKRTGIKVCVKSVRRGGE